MSIENAVPFIALVVSIVALLTTGPPREFPRWWERKPAREQCCRKESNLRGTKVRRCDCGTHRGEPWPA